MSPGYIAHLKAGLRRESEKQLDLYKKDKFAFIEGAFTKRVRELEDNQEILRHIIANNPNDPNAHWCVPECRYYFKYGRIEDSEVIQKHRELEKRYRDNNAIVEPPTTTITSSD
jgi:hypothetical protein